MKKVVLMLFGCWAIFCSGQFLILEKNALRDLYNSLGGGPPLKNGGGGFLKKKKKKKKFFFGTISGTETSCFLPWEGVKA